MAYLLPQPDALVGQPVIKRFQARKVGQALPDPPPAILLVLLDLSLLPARRRVAELRIKQIVADHAGESGVDLA